MNVKTLFEADNQEVKSFWEQEACGTASEIVGKTPECTKEWFERIEAHRYRAEPFIHAVAQFTRHRGKKLLEVGVGAGTDHLQWARAGVECHGVDLTKRAIDLTSQRLALYGYKSSLQQIDAEILPFPSESFDVVYSWGVIHHSAHPAAIIEEVHRVLKPGGEFLGMMYHRRSLVAFKLWFKHAFLKGRPWTGLAEVVAEHMESPGTKAYTVAELQRLFSNFHRCAMTPLITPYDIKKLPAWVIGWIPSRLGWFVAIHAQK